MDKQPVKIFEIEADGRWYIFTSIGEHSGFKRFEVKVGTRGYIKRNEMMQDFFQVVISNEGSIAATYLSRTDTADFVDEVVPLNDQARPEQYWHQYWISFGK